MMRILGLILVSLLTAAQFSAQQLYMPRNVKKAFQNETRSPDGSPGKNYWQNTANYQISVTAAPPNKIIQGNEEIVYFNNSPDALTSLIFRLTPNSHDPRAPRENPVSAEYLTTGVTIDEFALNGKPVKWEQRGGNTWQSVKLETKLEAHQSIKIHFKWHYDMSTESGREGAIDSTTFFLAYFYPRVAVYDDTDGWDRTNFTEGHEFYNDFNNYEFEVTVPKNYVVWATGDLLNANEVLQPSAADRLKASMTSDKVIHVATAEELSKKKVTAQSDTVTWKWKAENVTDVAAAVSDHFIWDAGSVVVDKSTDRRTSVQAAYDAPSKDFEKMGEYEKHALDWISNNFPGVPYPYQKMTAVRGFADMEYPMMVNDSSQKDPNFTRFIVEHEILHTYFPFYMGINEQRYGFMDEGWTTAFEYMVGVDDLGKETADNIFKQFRVSGWIRNPSADSDLPIILPGDAMTGSGFGNSEYGKAALGYLAIKDLLGDDQFKKVLHDFIDRWHGKHTLPWDMFNSFNNSSGRDMNWFFNNWFFSNGYIDLAIRDASKTTDGYAVTVENVGGKLAPFNVVVTYADKSTEALHETAEVWHNDGGMAKVNVKTTKAAASISIDGGIFLDANTKDNLWQPN